MDKENRKTRKLGTVEKVFAYGKCGFICTELGEHYYFSPKSFPSGSGKLKEGILVSFTASVHSGKPMAEEIDAETPEYIRSVMRSGAPEENRIDGCREK